jgi:hypothetical protein
MLVVGLIAYGLGFLLCAGGALLMARRDYLARRIIVTGAAIMLVGTVLTFAASL